MTRGPRFQLVPIDWLKPHEAVDPDDVRALSELLLRQGFVSDPVWVDEHSGVILNGHHRVEALRRAGARRVPAWVVDYQSDAVRLDRWDGGPPLTKREVVERAVTRRLFPPKTTRHSIEPVPGHRTTYLTELGPPARSPRPKKVLRPA